MQRQIITRDGQPYISETRARAATTTQDIRPLTADERITLQAALAVRETVAREIVMVPCSNPDCSTEIPMTRRQFSDLSGPFTERYGKRVHFCCSQACQEAVEAGFRDGGYEPRKDGKTRIMRRREDKNADQAVQSPLRHPQTGQTSPQNPKGPEGTKKDRGP